MTELNKYREDKKNKAINLLDEHSVYQEEAKNAIKDFEKIENPNIFDIKKMFTSIKNLSDSGKKTTEELQKLYPNKEFKQMDEMIEEKLEEELLGL